MKNNDIDMEKVQTILTIDDSGNEVELQLLEIATVNEQDYALLADPDAQEDDEDAQVVLMRIHQEGDNYTFEEIQDDDEFDLVSKTLLGEI